jgi:hypothetical protein
MESAKSKAIEVATEDFNKAKTLAKDAANSGAYIYPIKVSDPETLAYKNGLTWFQGIFYFLSHRSLWKPLLSRLVPTMTLSVGSYKQHLSTSSSS